MLDCDAAFVAGMGNNNFYHSDAGDLFGTTCGDPLTIAGNGSADPGFLDPADGDYHLQFGSPMIDAGIASGGPADDYDGDPRPIDGDQQGGTDFDIGADEQVPPDQGIAGTVRDGSGNVAANICVDVYSASVFVDSTSTGSSGLYAIELDSGSYTVFFDECSGGVLGSGWWDDESSQGSADTVVVLSGVVTLGVTRSWFLMCFAVGWSRRCGGRRVGCVGGDVGS